MNLVGLQAFYYSHATALLCDGELAFFAEEEKLDRVKAARDGFPLQSLQAALAHRGIGLPDVDEIAYPIHPGRYARTLLRGALGSLVRAARRRGWPAAPPAGRVSLFPDRVLTTVQQTPPFLDPLIRHRIRYGGVPGRIPRIAHVPHHRAHASSAFYTSGLDEATVVIADGMGETESSSLWHGRGLSLERLEAVDFPNSLGEFYAAFTEWCGFRMYHQEGKLMGLAAYGGPDAEISAKMDAVIRVDDDGYAVSPHFTIEGPHSFALSYSDALVEAFGEPRRPEGEITDRHRNVAFAAQERLERAVLVLVRRAVRRTGCPDVCLSGGVAMNCKLNGAVLQSDPVRRLSVLPASNDAGAALGAAMARSAALGRDPRFALEHAYYGPGYGADEIERALRVTQHPYERLGPGELPTASELEPVAELLAGGRVVGLFAGRGEFGARALGARSILADPRRREMVDRVNASVKFREAWRPFAPVILEGFEAEYFVGGVPSRFMMKAFAVRPEKRDAIPAVVHVDGTCRPQSIAREANPVYFDLLSAFQRRTGVPVLLNTSLNVQGEPIVCRPAEALRCYLGTGMDALLIGPFLLRKQGL